MGSVRGRPFCIPTNKTIAQICQLEARPNGSLHGCLLTGLGANTRVCFSPIRFNRPLCTTVEVSESRSVSSGSTSVADSTLVPLTTANVCRTSTTVPNVSTTSNEAQSIASTRQHPVSWVEAVGQHYKTTDLSAETRNVLLAAWRQNTSSAYASAWSKWVCWCGQRKIDPLSAPIEVVLDFLTGQYKEGRAYRSINVYRSALSSVLPSVNSCKIGSHPLVSQLLKGIFNLRPPQPKYSHTWKVSRILEYIKSLGPNENLSLKVLSLKLVTLLGLTAPDRSSDLAKRDLRFRTFHPEGVSFSLSGLSKTSRPGDLAKTSFHAAFKEDKDLCPVECLKCYELRTREFRSFTNGVNKLFLSYILPHKPVSSATLARWIKSLLQLAGVDTTIFSAHSLRGAATTEALNQGVSVTDILGMADWSQESTFTRFYYKPLFNAAPGRAVLSAGHS